MLDRVVIETIERIVETGDEAIVKVEKGKVTVLQSIRRLRFKEEIEPESRNRK